MEGKGSRIAIAVLGIVAFTGLAWRHFLPEMKVRPDLVGQPTSQLSSQPKLVEAYGNLPLSFEANQGQSDARVKFLARGSNYTLFLTKDSAVFALRKSNLNGKRQMAMAESESQRPQLQTTPSKGASSLQFPVSISQMPATDDRSRTEDTVLSMKVAGANSSAIVGQDGLPGKSNYFIGNDPSEWHSNVPNYAKVKYAGVYPGVDLIYYGNQGQLEYDFVVQPGADVRRIILEIGMQHMPARADSQRTILHLAKNGDLLVSDQGGEVTLQKPTIYQSVANDGHRGADKHVIEGKYVLVGEHQVAFQVADYDRSKPLVIDPTLAYSTYLGGSNWEAANGIAVDALGDAYLAGTTASGNFPTTAGSFQTHLNGREANAFVCKLNATGSALIYSTYLGGSNGSEAFGIAVDASGNAYVTGWTASSTFPTTAGALQTTFGGGYDDAFVSKLNATGSALVYSTYLGGGSYDEGHGIAVDASGSAYVTGFSYSSNFPTTAGAFQGALGGYDDAFVSKLNPAGSALIYSTYLGGGRYDDGRGIAVDASGSAYVTGFSYSTNFPTTAGALQAKPGGGYDAFVSKLNAGGSALLYSTYLGGGLDDFGYGIAVDASDNAYVTGLTYSSNFPTTTGALQTTLGGGEGGGYDDAFVAKLNAGGSVLVYSTYLGGSGDEAGYGIAIDGSDNAYVTGLTYSNNFPTTPGAFRTTLGGLDDAFVSKLNAAGSALLYSTYLGGSIDDAGYSIAVDASGNAYAAGVAGSRNFPTTAGAFQTSLVGGHNAFVARVNFP
jgi:hypothetical protein